MKGATITEIMRSALDVPLSAIPLSFCTVERPYLLARHGLSENGCAIMLTLPYLVSTDLRDPTRNVSLYAVPRDYHGYAEELSKTLLPLLRESFPAYTFALFADHSPIREVEAAAMAGLGVIGENGLLITPEYGSFVFIAEIITNADYMAVTGNEVFAPPDPLPTCEGCGACAAACPSRSIERCDRTNCLSLLTQKKGVLTDEETAAIRKGGLVWGCDACQTVCPHNQGVPDTPILYFKEARIPRLSINTLDAMPDTEFSARAYSWRGRNTLRRNLEIFENDTERRPE